MTAPSPRARPAHLTPQPLAEFAERFGCRVHGPADGVLLTGITLSTDDVAPGDLFVALPGANAHGAQYAQAAAERGAVAIATDDDGLGLAAATGLPVAVIDRPRAQLGAMSAWVYGTADRATMPIMLATTGTNGKTSVSHLLDGMLHALGAVTGLSSTAERRVGDLVLPSRLTTPEAPEVHALLAVMREHGVDTVIVEVSAQALSRHRVDGLVFDVAGFTNLSHDHLDDYADMSAYFDAKLPLFQPDHARRGVVSLDSAYGAPFAARSGIPVTTIITPALADDASTVADWTVDVLDERADGTSFRLRGPDGRSLQTIVPVVGTHMAANAGLALVMLAEAGYAWERLVEAFDGGRVDAFIPGRLERVSGERGPAVYVDYGHSTDAFVKTLAAVRRVTPGRVVMMFGADGDRDTTKRAAMGAAAVEGSDVLVICDFNPRREDPALIRAALIEGARAARPDATILEHADPEEAIRAALSLVGEGDAVVWAGPGHEDHREVGGRKIPQSARAVAREALRDAGWPPA
ncbi:Mur ligase family protein [Microbacterium sp. No. 7]|uniref:Mur ligase family protein n=1 Tax=Microbacterium sp. No. 7 TaxID=1714373 RepID=UPI0006D053D7|nr:UDP-N-acetylmuramoyl-L-alanyl-D-glutamate--2,6-diaminopimelate ligase [Microbacterium sp. No. 7]ALJ21149.1 UDP-N-acetylmuramyl peptide synthase [Microbacterium sp. No. 7]